MRVQHNIMAMGAYRNYTNNVSAMKKNLERLSSGYKINRAGDDAAGLAISEKMRAQITGLQTAQKNAKDGISLVQTAEGALTEVHDMLNRMVELATMSANGTYESTTDRKQLQKEVDELLDEIDRIANSANFNGINLLDGSMDAAGMQSMLAAAASKYNTDIANADDVYNKAIADALAAYNKSLSEVPASKFVDADDIMLADSTDNDPFGTTGVGKGSIYQVDSSSTSTPGFQINLKNMSFSFNADYATDTASGITLNINGTTITISQQALGQAAVASGAVSEVKEGTTLDAEALAKTLAHYIGNTANNASDGKWTDAAGNTFKVSFDDDILKFEATSKDAAGLNYDVRMTCDIAKADNDEVINHFTTGTIAASGTAGAGANLSGDSTSTTISITVNWTDATGEAATNSAITFDIDLKTLFADEWTADSAAFNMTTDRVNKILNEIVTKFNADTTNNKGQFEAKIDGGKLVFTTKAEGETKGKLIVTGFTMTGAGVGNGSATAAQITAGGGGTKADGHDAYTAGMGGYTNAGNQNVAEITKAVKGQLASTSLKMAKDTSGKGMWKDKIDELDGAKITLGDDTYTITFTKDKNKNIIGGTITGGVNAEFKFGKDDTDDDKLAAILRAISRAAEGNETFSVGVSTDGKYLTLMQKDGDVTSMKDREELAKYITIALADPDKLAAAKEDAEEILEQAQNDAKEAMQQAKKDALAAKEATEAKAKNAKALTLQIGDTADNFNQLKVSILDCHAEALGIFGLKISEQDDAINAVAKIKDAINYVSDVRGTLGATQNRLDHTINNLSVMTENIQDAESTIRDTDIAEEMMAYTKNNILIQSAQAMLAQANQVPQGVLQLLQ